MSTDDRWWVALVAAFVVAFGWFALTTLAEDPPSPQATWDGAKQEAVEQDNSTLAPDPCVLVASADLETLGVSPTSGVSATDIFVTSCTWSAPGRELMVGLGSDRSIVAPHVTGETGAKTIEVEGADAAVFRDGTSLVADGPGAALIAVVGSRFVRVDVAGPTTADEQQAMVAMATALVEAVAR